MNAKRTARPGLSLVEVLVAIFVMGIGMLCLLVLFPVGLQNMRWAMQDDRLAAAAAVAIANAENVHMDPNTNQPFSLRSEPKYLWAANYIPDNFTNNALFRWHPAPLGGYPLAPNYQPAYDPKGPRPPVFVDSVGVLAYGGSGPDYTNLLTALPGPIAAQLAGPLAPFGFSVGCPRYCTETFEKLAPPFMATMGFQRPFLCGIPRVRSSHLTGLSDAILACTAEDEVTFGQNGQPVTATGMAERESRYTWAYMCRFPKGDDPNVVDMTIVLYNGRQLRGAAPGQHTSGEVRFAGTQTNLSATLGQNCVFIKGSPIAIIETWNYSDTTGTSTPLVNAPIASPFKAGDVIMDNTLIMPQFHIYAGFPAPNGVPYRYYAPFSTDWSAAPTAAVPQHPGNPAAAPVPPIHTGLANGFFYKVVHVSPVQQNPFSGRYYQEITLDRPALADGLEAVYLKNAVDIIEKSNGHMPGK